MIQDTFDLLDSFLHGPETAFLQQDLSPQIPQIATDEEEMGETIFLAQDELKESSITKANKQSVKNFVLEYERWEGRVVNVRERVIGARLTNTQGRYPERYVELDMKVFSDYGIHKAFEFGDLFEIRFDECRRGTQIVYEKHISMIDDNSCMQNDNFKKKLEAELRKYGIEI